MPSYPTLSLISWNVNSLRARWPLIVRLLEEERPDVLLLQETKLEDAIFPEEDFGDYGYNAFFWGQKSYNGVAILSKYPLEDRHRGVLGEEILESRYIEAVTAGIRVGSLYVPNGQEVGTKVYYRKLSFFQNLARHLASRHHQEEIFLIGGDFNVAPTDQDVYDPRLWRGKILCSEPERAAFQNLLAQGFSDVFAEHRERTSTGDFTWWDYRRRIFDPQKGLRIDHFLLSILGKECLANADVLLPYRTFSRPSDHAPIRCRIRRE